MLYLNEKGLNNVEGWAKAGVELPKFSHEKISQNTYKNPVWVHFGAGNIFRCFIANLQHKLLEQEAATSGIIAVDTFDSDMIDLIYHKHDSLSLFVQLSPDGVCKRKIVAGVGYALSYSEIEKIKLIKVFCDQGLQLASFTITEKGYAVKDLAGNFLPVVAEDIVNPPFKAKHVMSIAVMLLFERFKSGATPIAMLSLDNCSHNGDILKNSILTIAQGQFNNGYLSIEFIDWLKDATKVSFPFSMIDKITPRPEMSIAEKLKNDDIDDMEPIVTKGGNYTAAFVNAEVAQYLVVEDSFPNGRPPLEKGGVYFASREIVNKAEKMKVTACLNPLHTALAIYGCLLGYTSISAEMQNLQLKKLVEVIGLKEGIKVVESCGIINSEEFLTEVLTKRLPNSFIPDTPQRIACDTSLKMPIRFGETIKAYASDQNLCGSSLIGIKLVIAGWCRYLLAKDDNLNEMVLSSDPGLSEIAEFLKTVEIGKKETAKGQLKPILSNKKLFLVDLYSVGMGEEIEQIFEELISGKDAVKKTLEKYMS